MALSAAAVMVGGIGVVGGVSATSAGAADASTGVADIGWAAQSGGTSGGSTADAAHVYTVSTKAQLMTAIAGIDPTTGKKNKNAPKIIKWVGTIDMTEGKPYTDHDDQASRGEIKLNPNTTIIGVGSNAYLPNGWFKISKVDNVIIRNIKVTNPCDLEPKWDSGDGAGNYNSEFDGTTVDGGTHVWLDHMWYTDAPYTDDQEPLGNKDKNGVAKRVQCHDGSVDIKNGADYVTVSNTILEKHDKNDLVGASDSRTSDDGHLTVSFIADLVRDIAERAPRVRFGQVHSADNYFVGSRTDVAYPHLYSIGTGLKSKIISTNNVFEITGATAGKCVDVVRNPNTDNPEGAFVDTGSTVNGAAMTGCTAPTSVGWSLPSGYAYPKLATSQVKTYVLANAGTGKI
ncbi:pectate lyase [Actinoallomurus vinaceus]|uniref:Pectate lyase n=2 Tax=Actinoallomurus vinaceus TaxID=1080074 RepID=A0ABP8UH33_9ACTN